MPRHEVGYLWIESSGTKRKKIGLSSHGLQRLGEIQWIDLPAVGSNIDKEGTLFVLESSKAAIEVESPCAGTVVQARECTEAFLDRVQKQPEQEWLVELDTHLTQFGVGPFNPIPTDI